MKANESVVVWKVTTAARRVDECRAMLHIHGFLSAAENERVNRRIEKWAAKHGMTREKMTAKAGAA